MIRIYDVLRAARDKATNLIYGSVGDASNDEESALDNVAMDFFPYGICSIPPDATPEDAVEALVYTDAAKSFKAALGMRSAKMLETLGKMLPGQVILYAFGSKIVLKKRGISLMVEGDDGEMKAHLELSSDNDGTGKISFPYGYAVVDKEGFRAVHAQGFSIMAGGIGGIDPNMKSYIRLSADSITINGKTCLGSSASGIYMPATFALLPVNPGTPIPVAVGVPNSAESSVMIATGL